jgi:recombination protein RecT
MTQAIEKPQEDALAAPQQTVSLRFQQDVERQFEAQLGAGRTFTDLEKRLTQHIFLKVDQTLKAAEDKRTKGMRGEQLEQASEDPRAFTWRRVDRQKLALDTVHRISLGLDALIKNHLWPVPYFNNRTGLYNVDLRIGYVGADYVARKHAIEPPLQVIYELVYSTDAFRALPRDSTREVEGYEFEITQPFDRGDIVGGFGYIVYDDPRKNRLVLVTKQDFKRARSAAQSGDFWASDPGAMHLKTVVHRTTSKIALDPEKVNAAALSAVMADEYQADDAIDVEAQANANRQLIDVDDRTIDVQPQASPQQSDEPTPAEAEEIRQAELAEAGELFEQQEARGPGF